jgi:hypothetical protein
MELSGSSFSSLQPLESTNLSQYPAAIEVTMAINEDCKEGLLMMPRSKATVGRSLTAPGVIATPKTNWQAILPQ